MLWKKIEQDKGSWESWQGKGTCCNLNGVTLEQGFEGGEQGSHVVI